MFYYPTIFLIDSKVVKTKHSIAFIAAWGSVSNVVIKKMLCQRACIIYLKE